jgi:putative holliday junction resolvase
MNRLIIEGASRPRVGAGSAKLLAFCMRVLGVDYGQKRIGLALSDPTGLLARPWKTLVREGNPRQVADALAREAAALRREDDGLRLVVIGLPRRLGGDPHDLTRTVEAIADHLRESLDVPLVLQDERLSSREAERLLSAREPDWRKRKPLLDAMAAAVILQDYLDSLPRAATPEELDS